MEEGMETPLVVLRCGPYEACGLVRHRPWRLLGLLSLLRRHGFTCAPERVHARGHVELRVRGEVVFTCRVTDLEFGGDGGIDPLCQAALRAVQNAV
ncbi:UPF0728 protein C10orf53 homolog [Petromyzon marinus]|uniref:UPF0728 protein C10orf53 homolog isoform X1 n=1 Tax=Petromyzon marinus TaxID=7757 RepID=A0AAJ7WPR4_PETMA|nr:UPF0728 protein C10orf53 homolog isoform X1 [Petromyzon marinus]